ncbi:MAG: serine/threonine protein kinase [Verrucomicrobiaceae bacterium]|nr:MAG: serine/threonine protein kinase [Verrucomicrobiaceae bacterium]
MPMPQPQSPENIAHCHACGSAMNVAEIPPFSNVGCPACDEENRVKCEFGPYTLVRRHAVGGMSMVFAAHDPTLDREVALKILSEDFSADERRIAAFEEEARITASFSHPNVVRVLTTGKAFGRFYIAMELVPGGHFEHHIQERGQIPEIEMLPLAIEVAQGLKAAHAAGLIHRDVKPGNILLDAEGHAKLVDFGLALVTKGGTAKAAELWATPYYVPPETIEGFPEDFRSDIYAFGATLYHALAGKPSCGEETMSTTILRDAKKKVIPLSLAAPWLSEETCKIVQRAMAYDPKDRYQSYDELITRLDVALKRLQTGTAGVSSGVAAKRRAKSKRQELSAYVMAGLVLAGALAGGIWWVVRSGPQEQAKKTLTTAPTTVVADSDVESATQIVAGYREGRQAVEAGNYQKAAEEFVMLRDNSSVQEPTRTWAGVEAVVAGYLDGKPAEARSHADRVIEHIASLEEGKRIDSSLVTLLESLDELKPAPADPSSGPEAAAPRIMGWMIAGLKSWEQGLLDEAGGFFASVAAAKLSADEEWLKVYQKVAGDYQADLRQFKDPVFSSLPEDADGCRSAIEKLEKIHGELRTRGRARFNVRAWQLDITRQAKLLAGGEPEVEAAGEEPEEQPAATAAKPDLTTVMEKVKELIAGGDFAGARAYVRELRADPEGATRDSLSAVVSLAAVFLPDLEAELANGAIDAQMQLKSGERAISISPGKDGRPIITGADGRRRPVEWSEISPDSLIIVHRILVKNANGEIEKMRRHQCAISYDWLAGNRTRAVQAAGQLSQTSAVFKDTWDKIAPGLPE